MRVRLMFAALLVVIVPFAAEAAGWIVVPHMNGTLAINPDRTNSIYYSIKQDPAGATLRILYDGNEQGKVVSGADATTAWQAIRSDAALNGKFLWVPHMEGTAGIPYRAIQGLYFAPGAEGKPAMLRIIHDVDAKVIEGAEAEALWKQLSAK